MPVHRAVTAMLGLVVALAVPAAPAGAGHLRSNQWYLESLNITQAHAISKGAGVRVAVVDSGVDRHQDLKDNLLAGISVAADAPGDGRADLSGHGTNMAALIAAHGHDGDRGALGVAPAAKILPVKYLHKDENAPSSELMATAIAWATSHDADVISVPTAADASAELVEAVGTAVGNDIVVVAGAGDTGQQPTKTHPAALPGVLVVGATGQDGLHAPLSATSAQVQICAPGVDIIAADLNDKYANVEGTSAATAIVSGAAALVRAKFPTLSAPDVIHRLTATADDIGPPGRDDECGSGRLNIVRALSADALSSDDAPAVPASSSPPFVLAVLTGLVLAGLLATVLAIRRRRAG